MIPVTTEIVDLARHLLGACAPETPNKGHKGQQGPQGQQGHQEGSSNTGLSCPFCLCCPLRPCRPFGFSAAPKKPFFPKRFRRAATSVDKIAIRRSFSRNAGVFPVRTPRRGASRPLLARIIPEGNGSVPEGDRRALFGGRRAHKAPGRVPEGDGSVPFWARRPLFGDRRALEGTHRSLEGMLCAQKRARAKNSRGHRRTLGGRTGTLWARPRPSRVLAADSSVHRALSSVNARPLWARTRISSVPRGTFWARARTFRVRKVGYNKSW